MSGNIYCENYNRIDCLGRQQITLIVKIICVLRSKYLTVFRCVCFTVCISRLRTIFVLMWRVRQPYTALLSDSIGTRVKHYCTLNSRTPCSVTYNHQYTAARFRVHNIEKMGKKNMFAWLYNVGLYYNSLFTYMRGAYMLQMLSVLAFKYGLTTVCVVLLLKEYRSIHGVSTMMPTTALRMWQTPSSCAYYSRVWVVAQCMRVQSWQRLYDVTYVEVVWQHPNISNTILSFFLNKDLFNISMKHETYTYF